jgi:hypothetical protein
MILRFWVVFAVPIQFLYYQSYFLRGNVLDHDFKAAPPRDWYDDCLTSVIIQAAQESA